MNQYILDTIDQKAIDTELETSFTMMEYYMKRMRMESYLDTSMEEVYQEADRSLKEMWDSDTSAIHGREGEGAFWIVVKFLPRLIRNIIKWIVSHVRALFKKEKSAQKAREELSNMNPSEEVKEKFKEDMANATPTDPESSTSSESEKKNDNTQPAESKKKYTTPELTVKNIDPKERSNAYQNQIGPEPQQGPEYPQELREARASKTKALDYIAFFCKKRSTSTREITSDEIFDNIFRRKNTVSSINDSTVMKILGSIESAVKSIELLFAKQRKESYEKIKNTTHYELPKITSKLNDENKKMNVGFFNGLFFINNEKYNEFINQFGKRLTTLSESLDKMIKDMTYSDSSSEKRYGTAANYSKQLRNEANVVDKGLQKIASDAQNEKNPNKFSTEPYKRLRKMSQNTEGSALQSQKELEDSVDAMRNSWDLLKKIDRKITTDQHIHSELKAYFQGLILSTETERKYVRDTEY
jgi:hypothetical protein